MVYHSNGPHWILLFRLLQLCLRQLL
uniref:Uncharacterized protein n=1 Tax=Arundo donax TaxID=35708 RepID=A0A0A9GY08_ARUDO